MVAVLLKLSNKERNSTKITEGVNQSKQIVCLLRKKSLFVIKHQLKKQYGNIPYKKTTKEIR